MSSFLLSRSVILYCCMICLLLGNIIMQMIPLVFVLIAYVVIFSTFILILFESIILFGSTSAVYASIMFIYDSLYPAILSSSSPISFLLHHQLNSHVIFLSYLLTHRLIFKALFLSFFFAMKYFAAAKNYLNLQNFDETMILIY